MIGYSTVQAARELGISMTTMHRYMLERIIPFPKMQVLAGVRVRVWSEADLKKARAAMPTLKNGRKTRHKKKGKTKK
jgi:hypothetical protein